MKTLAPCSSSSRFTSSADREVRLRLAQAGGTGGAAGRMAGIHRDEAALEGAAGVERGRAADVEHQVAPLPAGVVAPDRLRESSKRERSLPRARSWDQATRSDQRVGGAVLDPVDVAEGAVEAERETVRSVSLTWNGTRWLTRDADADPVGRGREADASRPPRAPR